MAPTQIRQGQISSPVKATGAELDALTDDAKFLTAKAVQDGKNVPHAVPGTSGNVLQSDGTNWASAANTVPVKATGAEINTGTDDAKFLTAKALADATVGKIGAAWTSFTPAWTNLTVGAGTNTGFYTQIGKTVHFRTRWVFGAGAAVTGNITLTLPVTIKSGSVGFIGFIFILDSGTAGYHGFISASGNITGILASSTYGSNSDTSSTVPMTWTTNDEIDINGTYEAA